MSDQSDLIKCVRKYRSLDDRLKTLNSQTQQLREERKIAELEMADILKSSKFATISKLELNDDGTCIKIQRPDMWSKPWSLSARDLKAYLDEFWASSAPKTAAECHKYICERRKRDLVATDFAFTRIKVQSDSGNDDGDI